MLSLLGIGATILALPAIAANPWPFAVIFGFFMLIGLLNLAGDPRRPTIPPPRPKPIPGPPPRHR